MNRVLVTLVLPLITTLGIAQGTISTRSQPGEDQQPTNQKRIDDQAEYNAYITALNIGTTNIEEAEKKAEAMMAFVNQYPKSVVRIDALENAMAAYQAANDTGKILETARTILQENPNALRARAIVTALGRSSGSDNLREVCDDSQKGLQALPAWPQPQGLTGQDFEKQKKQMADIFYGGAGFCALQNKDYAGAKDNYLKAIQLDPTNVQDVYQLAIADLELSPMDLNGFWYGAKAIHLAGANAEAREGISRYIKGRYKNYTGSFEGWDQIVTAAATQAAPPANLVASIKPKPTPCDIAVDAVKNNDPDTLSFSDWEFVLSHATCSPANKEAADKVWQAVLAKQRNGDVEVKLKLPVLVISATRKTIQVAMTEDNQQARKADLIVNLERPALHPPAPGSSVDVVGVISGYTPDPFMFTMEKGAVPGAKHGSGVRKTVHHASAVGKSKA